MDLLIGASLARNRSPRVSIDARAATLRRMNLIAVTVAVVLGYLIGSTPVAWLLAHRRHGVDLREHGAARTGARDALTSVGVRTAALAFVLECLKGGVVGLGARVYSGQGWFAATAIAACVAGDAFPPILRRRGRGLIPLISGLSVALPLAAFITAMAALPAALIAQRGAPVYDMIVTIAVPVGLVAGTGDLRTLVPAAVIVLILLARARGLRNGRVLLPWRSHGLIIDSPPSD